MKIIIDYPPIYDYIRKVFPDANRGVIFAWGGIIYNPSGIKVKPELVAHESVHGRRQGKDIRGWWEQYLYDKEFRLVEETFGHFAEMDYLLGPNPNRQMRRRQLKQTAKRLARPVYRYGITRARAEQLLKDRAEQEDLMRTKLCM